MDNLLIAIDFTDLGQKLIKHGVSLADKYDAKLWIIHVAAPDPDFVSYSVGPKSVRENRAKELREEHRQLQAFAKEISQQDIDVESLLIQGVTADSILEEVNKLNADLIIIGAHKHGWLYENFIGNTWSDIVNYSKVPVLVVPE